jgi:hypothetical protein
VGQKVRQFFVTVLTYINWLLRADTHTALLTAGSRPGLVWTIYHIIDSHSISNRFYSHFDRLTPRTSCRCR